MSNFRADDNVILLGDLNISGDESVTGMNESGERLIKVCSELGLLIGNM